NSHRKEYSYGHGRLAGRADGNTHEQPVPTDVSGLSFHVARAAPATLPAYFYRKFHRNANSGALIVTHRLSTETSHTGHQSLLRFCHRDKRKTLEENSGGKLWKLLEVFGRRLPA